MPIIYPVGITELFYFDVDLTSLEELNRKLASVLQFILPMSVFTRMPVCFTGGLNE